jgi:hypothetical protein
MGRLSESAGIDAESPMTGRPASAAGRLPQQNSSMALTSVRLALALFAALVCSMCARGATANGVQYIVGLHSKPRSLVRFIFLT